MQMTDRTITKTIPIRKLMVNVKNTHEGTIPKGTAAFIDGAEGSTPTIKVIGDVGFVGILTTDIASQATGVLELVETRPAWRTNSHENHT